MTLKNLFWAVVVGASIVNAETNYKITDYKISRGNSDGVIADSGLSMVTPAVTWRSAMQYEGLPSDTTSRKEGFPVTSAEFIADKTFTLKRRFLGVGDGKPTTADYALGITGALVQGIGVPGMLGAGAAHLKNALIPTGK